MKSPAGLKRHKENVTLIIQKEKSRLLPSIPIPIGTGTGTSHSKTKPLSFKSYKYTPQPPDKNRDKLSQEVIIASVLFRNP
jgi:hypothetical protein